MIIASALTKPTIIGVNVFLNSFSTFHFSFFLISLSFFVCHLGNRQIIKAMIIKMHIAINK